MFQLPGAGDTPYGSALAEEGRTELPWWKPVAVAVLVLDMIALSLHAFHLYLRRWGTPEGSLNEFFLNTRWNGQNDGSYGEVFGYVQLGAAGLLLIVLALRERHRYVYAAWGGVLLVMTADDALRWHEQVGMAVASWTDRSHLLLVPVSEVGEIAFWGVLSLVLGSLLVIAHRRSSVSARRGSWELLSATVLLAVFAVGVDLVSSMVLGPLGRNVYALVVYAETVGELVFVTAILVVSLRIAARGGIPADRGGVTGSPDKASDVRGASPGTRPGPAGPRPNH